MSLNSQIQNMGGGGAGGRGFIFKEGVKVKYMSGKDPIVFRVLPAFHPGNPDPSTSVIPFMTPEGQVTDWGVLLYVSRFAGHGKGGYGTRQDLISLRTFARDGEDVYCPVEQLLKTINAMPMDWGYLTEEKGEGRTRDRAAIGKPQPHFIVNIWDLNQVTAPAQIGMFTGSASRALTDPKTGLIFQRTNLPDEVIANNYLLAYQVGDLTDPNKGPALVCAKGNENGEFSKYRVSLATDSSGRVVQRPVGPEILATRYDMGRPDTFLVMPTEESLIQQMVELFNMRSPAGHHEYALLKQAFPQFRIPEPPSAPAARPAVAMGGYGVPEQQQAPQQAPQGPVYNAPSVPANNMGYPGGGMLPGVYPANGGVAAPMPSMAPEMAGVANNMAAAGPIAPGDPIPGNTGGQGGWNRESFMAKLKQQG